MKRTDNHLYNFGDKVKIFYSGYFADGKVFDSNMQQGTPKEFVIGNVIPGWNELLQLIGPGYEVISGIPSRLAYGKEGILNRVPADTVLFFYIRTI